MNLSNTLTTVATVSHSSSTRSNAFMLSHAKKHSNPVRPHPTVPLVITYNPSLRSVSFIIQKHFSILSSSPRCTSVFTSVSLVAFRRTDNLSDILVKSKLRTVTQTNVSKGSFRCGNNCITCHYITDGRTKYTFSATGETRTIPDHIDCNFKNLIYMVHCRRCNKQYIGETKKSKNTATTRRQTHPHPQTYCSFRPFSFRRSCN